MSLGSGSRGFGATALVSPVLLSPKDVPARFSGTGLAGAGCGWGSLEKSAPLRVDCVWLNAGRAAAGDCGRWTEG